MKIVKLKGGLGNQMFQFAFAKSLELKQKEIVKLDMDFFEIYKSHNGLEIDKLFNIPNFSNKKEIQKFKGLYFYWLNKEWSIKTIEKKILGKNILYKPKYNYIIEKNINKFNKTYLELKGDYYFEGYFQSYKYFQQYNDEIRKIFAFPKIVDKENLEILKKIKNTNSISLHIRRGDYLTKNSQLNVLTMDYYKNAIQYILKNAKKPVFFIFSDDIKWCKKEFDFLNEKYFIDWNKKNKSFIDMQLISLCKHNIIANSSFSWWSAWLNKNPNKIVVCPKFWFIDVINNTDRCLEEWKRI